MKLYIANTTKQRHIFTFRQLETGRLRQIPIEHGSQMQVLDGSTEEVEAVIQHHQVYGLVDSTRARHLSACATASTNPFPPALLRKPFAITMVI